MLSEQEIEQLLATPSSEERERWLHAQSAMLTDDTVVSLKNQAIQTMRTDTQRALQLANLLSDIAQITRASHHRGYGLWAEAVVRSLGLSEFPHALRCYDEALAIFHEAGDLVSQATIQISRLWSLASLGHHQEAFAAGQWAAPILQAHERWMLLASLQMNLALISSRLGDDAKALGMIDQAQHAYQQLGLEGELLWAQAEHNRSIALRNLGRFDESIAASQAAQATQERLGHKIEAARAQQGLGITYFVLGRYNEALHLMEQARDIFANDGAERHALRVELYICDCLLQLRRFADVLDKCQQIRGRFHQLETPLEEAQAMMNEALAYAGLHHHEKAVQALQTARHLFTVEQSPVWVAYADLEIALLFYTQKRLTESLTLAQACAAVFAAHDLPVKAAEAYLVAARAASGLERYEESLALVNQTLAVGESKDIPALIYQARHLRGNLANLRGDVTSTQAEYEAAIAALERLRGRLMVEFRVNFQEDKQILYEDMVDLCLSLERPDQALQYAERAKSRALLDLLSHRLDLQIRVRDEADRPLVEKLLHLRAQRDQIYRRWAGNEERAERGWSLSTADQQAQQDVLTIEKEITALWHTLLIHKATEYAQDAALWQVRTEPIQGYLSPDTLLIEYFVVHEQLVLFLVTSDTIQAHRLAVTSDQIRQSLAFFNLNLNTVPHSTLSQIQDLTARAQKLLHQLYNRLLAPVAESLSRYPRLIFVPHGPLHYLPFHALYDGRNFLLENHNISYLPNASLLGYGTRPSSTATERLAFGHSQAGQLPHAASEAQRVAEILGGHSFVEAEATPDRLRAVAPTCQILHLATHAEYHADQPLFSGLSLDGGWLTTLDIFNLNLPASLVTLSACQTGRSVVGGGDELLGLMRAFLYAGAASLVLSLWSVEDRSTSLLMELFYHKLAEGWDKSAALRYAQQQLIHSSAAPSTPESAAYAHPYFWAPFFLVGQSGPLLPLS